MLTLAVSTVGLLLFSALSGSGKAWSTSFGETDVPANVAFADRRLAVFSCGVREVLWTDVYSVAFYLPKRQNEREALWDAAVPKVIRVEIVYEGEIPDSMPSEWQERLRAALEEETFEDFKTLYGELSTGDVVEVAYAPKRGAVVRLNQKRMDGITVQAPHAFMESLLDLWAGSHPVSKGLRRELVNRGC